MSGRASARANAAWLCVGGRAAREGKGGGAGAGGTRTRIGEGGVCIEGVCTHNKDCPFFCCSSSCCGKHVCAKG